MTSSPGMVNIGIQSFHPNLVRTYLEVAASQPLHRSFPVLVWYVENAVTRFGKTNEATTFIRPLFDATVFGAQLAGHIAGRTLTRLKALRQKSSEFGVSHSLLVTPGSREEAVRIVAAWLERNLGEFVKIADQYFSPADLTWLQVIRTAKPSCEITVLTGRHSQPTPAPGSDLEEVYVSAWRQMFDQSPPKAKIAVIGGDISKKSPIHDRWLLTASAGLRFGTSLNSLGLTKDSEISELSIDDAEQKLNQVNQYLDREKAEHDGEKLRLSSFWLT